MDGSSTPCDELDVWPWCSCVAWTRIPILQICAQEAHAHVAAKKIGLKLLIVSPFSMSVPEQPDGTRRGS